MPCWLRRLRSFLPRHWRRVVHGGTGRIYRSQAKIVFNGVRARSGTISDVNSARCRIVDGDLHARVPGDDVLTDDISFDPSVDNDSVCVPDDDVIDEDVVVGCAPEVDETDAEIATLTRVTISTQPVRTEPVAARAARQSYAAASSGGVPVSHRNVRLQLVVRRRHSHENSRHAIRRGGHLRDKYPRTAQPDPDAVGTESLNDSRSLEHHTAQAGDVDPNLARDLAAAATSCGIALPSDREPVQLQRDAGRTEHDAWCAGNGAGHIANELAVFRDRQRAGDSAANVRTGGRSPYQDKAHAEHQRRDLCPSVSHVALSFHGFPFGKPTAYT